MGIAQSKKLSLVKQAVQSGKAELCRGDNNGKAPMKDGREPLRSKEEDEKPWQVMSGNCEGTLQK